MTLAPDTYGASLLRSIGIAPVRFVDGKDLFWWGVRTPAARQRLATLLGH